MKIKWDYISNKEFFSRADAKNIEIKLVSIHLRWLGHASRMDEASKSLGELSEGTRPIGRPKL